MDWAKETLQKPMWKEEIKNREAKEQVAKKMAERVQDGDIIGFGSGSTSYLTAIEIAKKVQTEHLNIIAIPTSYEIKMLCTYLGIPTATLEEKKPDWCFDGADEVDHDNWMIKGRGAAMFNEKLNIKCSNKTYILVDESKIVNRLGSKFPVPVECTPKAINLVKEEIYKQGAHNVELRLAGISMEFIRDQLNIANIPFRENERQRRWTRKAISYILSNEKYIGDSLWQKTYSGDTFPHTQCKNKGEKAKYYVEGTHSAIVEKSIWNAVAELRMQRASEKHPETYCTPVPFRQKIICVTRISYR